MGAKNGRLSTLILDGTFSSIPRNFCKRDFSSLDCSYQF